MQKLWKEAPLLHVYICIYIYIYIHTHIHIQISICIQLKAFNIDMNTQYTYICESDYIHAYIHADSHAAAPRSVRHTPHPLPRHKAPLRAVAQSLRLQDKNGTGTEAKEFMLI